MTVLQLKTKAIAWIEGHVPPGGEFRNVNIREGLRLHGKRSRQRLSYVLKLFVDEGRLIRTGRRLQGYMHTPGGPTPVVRQAMRESPTPPFLDIMAFIVEYLHAGAVEFVRTADLLIAIAQRWNVDPRLLRSKTAWQQNYCWVMHRLQRRGWIHAWGKARVEVSPALLVDLARGKNGALDYHAIAAWLDKWWRDYEAAKLKPSSGPTLLDQLRT